MGAALHLAHATELPTRKRKRKGGGGSGDGYDQLVARVYKDKRMTSQARDLILMLAWLVQRDPDRFAEDKPGSPWNRADTILGTYGSGPRKGSRLADLIDSDRPRYEPDWSSEAWQSHRCAAPMIRRAGECGQNASDHSLRIDPETGWQTPVWFCSRHKDFGHHTRQMLRATERPEPIPNAGGLMPSYLEASDGDAGWIRVYLRASEWTRSRWEPPKAYSLRADDWPVPGQDPIPQKARLRLVLGGGDLDTPHA
ncbi:hypothetical protein AB0D56_30835 [Streptomyces sp. NPDC048209]|uniref:hypothetical protein n=1 Tax=Streptomyces sp. NPDC048209 TaxID=3156689 RepID=UPI00341AE889